MGGIQFIVWTICSLQAVWKWAIQHEDSNLQEKYISNIQMKDSKFKNYIRNIEP